MDTTTTCCWNDNSSERCECEISFGGEEDLGRLYAKCQKNPGHTRFFPLANFSKTYLPEEYSNNDVIDLIYSLADLTARIVVRHISKDRPEKWPGSETYYPFHHMSNVADCIRTGTGVIDFVMESFSPVHGKCPCHECVASSQPREEWWHVRVNTAAHVVFDTSEAKSTIIECFFNSNHDRVSNVKNLYGLYISENPGRMSSDWCVVVCATHDKDLARRLMDAKLQKEEKLERSKNPSSKDCVVIISHPHGCCKKVSVGFVQAVTIHAQDNHWTDWTPFKSKTVCRIPSTTLYTSNFTMARNSVNASYCGITSIGFSYGNGIQLVPGTEFTLPKGTSFFLPPSAPFIRRIFSASGSSSYSFPAKTRFVLSDGREFQLPPGTQFFGSPIDNFVGSLSYTTETCPGCSGACVLLLGKMSSVLVYQGFAHSCSTSSGLNKSSTGIFMDAANISLKC